jgi:hypothetical protein
MGGEFGGIIEFVFLVLPVNPNPSIKTGSLWLVITHKLVLTAQVTENLSEGSFTEMVKEIYRGTTAIIELPSADTNALNWTHGVKQGCPLSPLLFDLRIEPLLRHLDAIKHEVGYIKNDIVYCVLAYADDSAFVSDTVEKQQRILRIFEDYCEHAKLKVNVEKCATTSIFDREERGRRHSIWVPLTLCGKDVPVNIHTDSVKSLGFPLGGNRHERSLSGNITLTKMRLTIDKITKSPLSAVQKIQALLTYVLPRIDFPLLNSDVLEPDLKAFDEHMAQSRNGLEAGEFRLLSSTCRGRTVVSRFCRYVTGD